MRSKTERALTKSQRPNQVNSEGLNWLLIAGGALLSTLSIRLGFKLKQALSPKRPNATSDMKERLNSNSKGRSGTCRSHSNMYCFEQSEDGCYRCFSGGSEGIVDMKQPPHSPMSKELDATLPLATISAPDSNRENSLVWASSPERLELPRKPFHSNSSDSPCVSECGSDILTKKEVVHKLRQQLKRRDEMILEMQAQITEFQNSLRAQISKSSHLQSQLDSANQDLFDSEREIQRLRKAIADHCVGEMGSPEKPKLSKHVGNGHANGFFNGNNNLELQFIDADQVREESLDRYEMLKKEVGELKEVIGGKEFLLKTYKDQQSELHSTIKELQLRLASQVPNIL